MIEFMIWDSWSNVFFLVEKKPEYTKQYTYVVYMGQFFTNVCDVNFDANKCKTPLPAQTEYIPPQAILQILHFSFYLLSNETHFRWAQDKQNILTQMSFTYLEFYPANVGSRLGIPMKALKLWSLQINSPCMPKQNVPLIDTLKSLLLVPVETNFKSIKYM